MRKKPTKLTTNNIKKLKDELLRVDGNAFSTMLASKTLMPPSHISNPEIYWFFQ